MPLFLPLDDDNPRLRLPHPWVNWTLIGLCIGIFAIQFIGTPVLEQNLIRTFAAIPQWLVDNPFQSRSGSGVPAIITLVSYTFLHGGFVHLLLNMLVLWVYGDNVEDAMGHINYALFYTICGILAVLSQVLINPASLSPIIGASGAIAGVMGAYFVLYPKARLLVPILIFPVYLPAYLVLSVWMLFQIIAAFQSGSVVSGVAWWAHIGGFVAGLILVKFFRHKSHLHIAPAELPSGIEIHSFARDHNTKRARSRRDER
ncbi:rhomboid family intramembrane serine protease [Pelagibius sp. Alg239-R121]|uniref:rhomboid family intramembrane serine protease n=1 Tax=Pelagibius sp. Alg239-R121 TaxID=2993448 RepID=UPI0024A6BC25|nr:rhomboid family intramembrane serine protease [Pelagibius sp. Alg239-R121]